MASSWMAHEIASVPELVARQEVLLADAVRELVSRLVRHPPQFVVICARGSSAHAGLFAKHVIELHLGIPVAPAAPSIASIYRRRLELRGQLVLIISQSGTSDDLIEFAKSARELGRPYRGRHECGGFTAELELRRHACNGCWTGTQCSRDQDVFIEPVLGAAAGGSMVA